MVNFTHSRLARRRFTLIELLVVVAIISVIASMLLPSLSKAKGKAITTSCGSNMKQQAIAFTIYQSEMDGFFPWANDPNQGSNMPWHRTLAENTRAYAPWAKFLGKIDWSSPVWCPGTLNPEVTVGDGTWGTAWYARYFVSYSLPGHGTGALGAALGGGSNGVIRPPRRINEVLDPAVVANLVEGGTGTQNLGSVGGVFYESHDGSTGIGLVPSYLDGIGRHSSSLEGSNILFTDGHIDYFPNGGQLWLQWRSGQTGQSQYPFNADLR